MNETPVELKAQILQLTRYFLRSLEKCLIWVRPHREMVVVPVKEQESRAGTLMFFMVGGYAAMFGWIYFSNWLLAFPGYPSSTFLFIPEERFQDYANMIKMSVGLDPYNTHSRSSYPPFANLCFWLFSLFPLELGLIVYILIPIPLFWLWGQNALFGLSRIVRYAGGALLFILSYGVLLCIDRANFDLYIVAFVIGWWWLYDRPGWRAEVCRAVLMSAAVAGKLYPVMLLLIVFKDRRWRELILVITSALGLTLVSAACFNGGAAKAFHDWFYMTGAMQTETAIHTHFSLNLNSNVKTLAYLVKGVDDIAASILGAYTWLVLGILAGAIWWLLRTGLERWRVLSLLVVLMLVLPSVSGDYKLAHLLLLLPALLRAELGREQREWLLICVGLLLVPKAYGMLFLDTSTSVLVNPILLLALAFGVACPAGVAAIFRYLTVPLPMQQRTGFVALAAFLPAALFLSLFWNKFLPLQEGWFQYYGRLMKEGAIPYRDFYSFIQPLPLYLSRALVTVSDAFIVFRVYGVIERLMLLAVLVLWLRRFASPVATLLGAVAGFFIYQSNTTDLIFSYYQTTLLLALLGALATDHVLRRSKADLGFAALAGACAMAAFFCEQSAGLVVLFGYFLLHVVAAWQQRRWSLLASFCLAAISLGGLVLLPLVLHGSLMAWWEQIFRNGGTAKGSLSTILFGFLDRDIQWKYTVPALAAAGFGLWLRFTERGRLAANTQLGLGSLILWILPMAAVVLAVYHWPLDYMRFYELLSGYALKLWLVKIVFFLTLFLSLVWVGRLPFKGHCDDGEYWSLGGAFGLSAAWIYAHGMSFSIEEHAALPGVPLVLALGYDAFLKRGWRGAQVGLGIVAMVPYGLSSLDEMPVDAAGQTPFKASLSETIHSLRVFREHGLTFYAAHQLPVTAGQHDIILRGAPTDHASMGPGWHEQEGTDRWMSGRAQVFFRSGAEGVLVVEGYLPGSVAPNTISLLIDGKVVHTQPLTEGVFHLVARIPPNSMSPLTLTVAKHIVPRDEGLNEDARDLGLMITRITTR